MKLNKYIAVGAIFVGIVSMAQGQIVINITGATAFRDAADATILSLMGGNNVAQRARADIPLNGSSSNSNLRIYRGFINGTEYLVRATYSGSTQGILDVADGNSIPFLNTNTVLATTGTGAIAGATQANNTTNAVPRYSFSDVDKLLSARPNASLGGGPVGVVPFMFLGGVGTPVGVTNMTDQIHNTLWSLGTLPASVVSGDPADASKIFYATGRNNGSGTRASILSETQYGSTNNVVQYDAPVTGSDGAGTVGTPTAFLNAANQPDNNGGHASNSNVKSRLTRTPSNSNVVFMSYLTISDAVTATGYNVTTGVSTGGQGAKALTYNGVRYSPANVNNGAYTLWGYQQLYIAEGSTAAEQLFFDRLKAGLEVQANLGSAGLTIAGLAVERIDGDGGPILPLE